MPSYSTTAAVGDGPRVKAGRAAAPISVNAGFLRVTRRRAW
jgi:hypothetical protein